MAAGEALAVDGADETGPSTNLRSATPWDPQVLMDMLSLDYVLAVVFTDGNGLVLHSQVRADVPYQIGDITDIAIGALSRAGDALEIGPLGIAACLYRGGILVAARSNVTNVAVLAKANANLGQLLNQVRRIFR